MAGPADTYVLASIEKLGTVGSYRVVGTSEVAGVVTDAPADHPTVQEFRARGVNIIQA
jgi:DeoR/GlpR family transcriptional regulator of sugar metabolism